MLAPDLTTLGHSAQAAAAVGWYQASTDGRELFPSCSRSVVEMFEPPGGALAREGRREAGVSFLCSP